MSAWRRRCGGARTLCRVVACIKLETPTEGAQFNRCERARLAFLRPRLAPRDATETEARVRSVGSSVERWARALRV